LRRTPPRSLAEQRRIVARLESPLGKARALRDLEVLEQSILAAAFRGE